MKRSLMAGTAVLVAWMALDLIAHLPLACGWFIAGWLKGLGGGGIVGAMIVDA